MALLVVVAAADMFLCSHVFVGHGWFSVIVHVILTGLSVPGAFALLYWKTEEFQYLLKTASRIITKAKKKLAR